MDYLIIFVLGILILGPVFYAYYLDYKADPKEFSLGMKPLKKGLIHGLVFFVAYYGINKIYELTIPLNKKHGIEFNTEREKLAIPKIKEDWKIDNHYSEQFKTEWWKPEPRNGHFKKIIEYGVFGVKYETDYYHNPNLKGTFAWSIYDYNKNIFVYFMEQPNDKLIEVTEKGKIKHLKSSKTIGITKSEFDNYKTE
ncbi:hypothetical protein [Aquimarina sp. LLG6339-5]|uniref:hypothetical protein n=1 Tax=Aquimarina sp. LLG6339-5 TaxID=3160830 RepID=UPI00386EDAE3